MHSGSDHTLKVFLGGTVNGSAWRKEVIAQLKINYFNPVVDNWDEAARLLEIEERKNCDYNLYVLTPKMIGFYSIAEVVDDSFKKPGQTLFCFLNVDGSDKFTTKQLTSLRYLGKVVEQNGGIWCKSIDEVTTFFNKLHCKAEYYHIYQKLLEKAVRWNRNNRNSSLLLKGFPLIDTRRWLKEANQNDVLSPTQLIKDYYQASSEDEVSSRHITTFISYARTPSLEFASELFHELEANGVNSWFDKQNIRAGVDFREEIRMGVERAGNFIYIITNKSIHSPYCQMELDLAKSAGKRILPIQHGKVDESKIDPDIQPIHRLFYAEETKEELGKVVSELTEILKEGQDFIHYHTKFLRKAVKWKNERKSRKYLLKGNELTEGYNWLTSTIDNLTPSRLTYLHSEYITRSKQVSENDFVDFWVCSHRETAFERKLSEQLLGLGMTMGTTWYQTDNTIGIIKSAKFIWVISSGSTNSEKCLSEVDFARKNHLTIIPLLVEKIDVDELLNEQEREALIDLSARIRSEEGLMQQLSKTVFRKELEDHKELRFLRYRHYKWKNSKEDDAFLLRNHCMVYYRDWLAKKQSMVPHFYTKLKRYLEVCESVNPELITEVFIAHHEESAHFAFLVNEKLSEYQKVCWSDQSFVSDKDQSMVCLDNLEAAENFVGIISEKFFQNATAFQIKKAKEIGKRIVFIREDPEVVIPEAFSFITVIDFNEDFELSMIQLVRYLDTDFQYVKKHSQLLREALVWDRSGKRSNKLLRGAEELEAAQEWMKNAGGKTPNITKIQKTFIKESVAEQVKSSRLKKAVVYAIVTLAVFSLVFGVWAGLKSQEAKRNLELAKKQTALADSTKLLAQANALEAQENANEAQANADSAQAMTQEVRRAAKEAERQSMIAKTREEQARASEKKADSLKVIAIEKAVEANQQKGLAEKSRSEADKLASIEAAKRKALLAEKLLLSSPKGALDSLIEAYEALREYPEHQKSDIFFEAFSRVCSALPKNTQLLKGKRALVKSELYEGKIYSLSENGVFHIADMKVDSQRVRLSSESLVNALTFTIDGGFAFFGNRFGQLSRHRIVRVPSGQDRLKLLNNYQVHAPNTTIVGVKYLRSKAASYLLSVGYDGSVIISSVDQAGLKPRFENEPGVRRIKVLDVSPNQKYLAVSGPDMKLEYYRIDELVPEEDGVRKLTSSGQISLSDIPTAMKFLDDNRVVIGYFSGKVDLLSLRTGQRTKIESQQEHKKAITTLDLQGGVLVSGSRDAQVTLRIWDNQKIAGYPDWIYKYPGHSSPNEIREIIFVGTHQVVSMDNKNLLKWTTSVDKLYQSLKKYRDEETTNNLVSAEQP